MNPGRHTVETLKDLIDERDRRYEENRRCDQEAVKLAKEIADKARGTVSVSLLIGVVALILAIVREIK